ncbi:MAG: transcriptional repressor LexA [Firmicutes bacterium]|nr:transcriptional repressor LexA [Bacillota bacterium]
MTLNDKDYKILDFIKSFIDENRYPPSVREICAQLKIKSTATVYFSIHRLEDAGLIRQSPLKKRSIEVLSPYPGISKKSMVEIPLVGNIAAGQPITAIENIEDIYNLPNDLFGLGDLFMLNVSGDSMINAGIFDGDKIIVRKQENAENGEIIAAMINGEATVKRFYKENHSYRLQPENDAMQPIITEQVDIAGKIVGLIRKF